MRDLNAIFRAGLLRRWHMNPDLAHTCDRIDGHAGRMARILWALHPEPSSRLLGAALIHDDGESVVGDVKAPTKDGNPALADALEAAEAAARLDLWGPREATRNLSDDERRWLKFADRLDAYMWAHHHAPGAMHTDGWPEARRWLFGEAAAFRREAAFVALAREAGWP